MSQLVLMTASEARQCVDAINHDIMSARQRLLDLYEREGWRALGYSGWRECVTAEFRQSRAYLYRQLRAAQIERAVSPIGDSGLRESHLRELARLPDTQAQAQVLTDVVQEHGADVTAADVRAAVDERLGVQRPTAPKSAPVRAVPIRDAVPDYPDEGDAWQCAGCNRWYPMDVTDCTECQPPLLAVTAEAAEPETLAVPSSSGVSVIEIPPLPEASPEERAYDALQRQRLLTRFSPTAIAAVVSAPADALPGFEAFEEWLRTFVAELRERAREPLRVVK